MRKYLLGDKPSQSSRCIIDSAAQIIPEFKDLECHNSGVRSFYVVPRERHKDNRYLPSTLGRLKDTIYSEAAKEAQQSRVPSSAEVTTAAARTDMQDFAAEQRRNTTTASQSSSTVFGKGSPGASVDAGVGDELIGVVGDDENPPSHSPGQRTVAGREQPCCGCVVS